MTNKCKGVVQKWIEASTAEDYDRIVAEYPDLKKWSQDLKIAILGTLREHELIWPEDKFEKLTGQFELRDTNNIELRTPWIRYSNAPVKETPVRLVVLREYLFLEELVRLNINLKSLLHFSYTGYQVIRFFSRISGKFLDEREIFFCT